MKNTTVDKSNMRKVILDFPKQLEGALKLAKGIKVVGPFENIIICGVGGSALSSNILISWVNSFKLKNSLLPIYTHRDYNLPIQANEKSLIICISYSGNTEEPVSALKEAVKKKLKIVAIATGGKIEAICRKNNIPLIKIPSGIQPRSATGYLFTSLVEVLEGVGILPNTSKDIQELAKELKKISLEEEGKKIAKKLINKIPLIYSSNKFKNLARVWKIKFNENSKIPSFYNYFPELNHNEMVGFTNKKLIKNFCIIILKDKSDHPRNLERMDLFAKLMRTKGIRVEFINIRTMPRSVRQNLDSSLRSEIKSGDFLFKVLSTLILGDWVSYYLALEYKIDPTPVKIVEEFKKKLKE